MICLHLTIHFAGNHLQTVAEHRE